MQARAVLAAVSLLCAFRGEAVAAPPTTVKGASTKGPSPTASPTAKSSKGSQAKSPTAKPAPKSKTPPNTTSAAKKSSAKGASAKTGTKGKPKGKQAKPKGQRGAKAHKRKSLNGAPVLRSRATPGVTKTRKGASEAPVPPPPAAAVAAGATVIDAKMMTSLLEAMPPKHAWIDAGRLDLGNVWAEFKGSVWAKNGTFRTRLLRIFYPIPGALGRDLKVRCWHMPSNATRTVAVVSRDKDGTETTWDQISISPGTKKLADGTVKTKWANQFEVVVDTDKAAKDETSYRLEISANKDVVFRGCLLKQLD